MEARSPAGVVPVAINTVTGPQRTGGGDGLGNGSQGSCPRDSQLVEGEAATGSDTQ